MELVDNTNESTNNANYKNYPSQLHSGEIERVAYKISNSTGNYEEEQRPRYQRQDTLMDKRSMLSESSNGSNSNNHVDNSSSKLEIIELSSLVSHKNLFKVLVSYIFYLSRSLFLSP